MHDLPATQNQEHQCCLEGDSSNLKTGKESETAVKIPVITYKPIIKSDRHKQLTKDKRQKQSTSGGNSAMENQGLEFKQRINSKI